MTIDAMPIGREAVILRVGGEGVTRTHFLGMGLTPGTRLKVVKRAPMGDPIEIQIRGYALTLRKSDAADIEVEMQEDTGADLRQSGTEEKGYNAYLHEHNAIRDWVRAESIIPRITNMRCLKVRSCPLPLPGSRTAARRRCSMS